MQYSHYNPNIMALKVSNAKTDDDHIANIVDPNQTPPRVCTVCPDDVNDVIFELRHEKTGF